MSEKQRIRRLREALYEELTHHILPYWEALADPLRGGYCGRVTGHDVKIGDACRSAVLNMRLLWTFSAAARLTGDERWFRQARRCREYVERHFLDPVHGGVYWSVRADGTPLESKKQIYALGFAIYGMSEYARATGDSSALRRAVALFRTVEQQAWDPLEGGYFEAFAQDWSLLEDMRLSSKDRNACKTMNTHLHLLEPYTNLLRVWPDPQLSGAVQRLCRLFCDRILDRRSGHLRLFFDARWNPCDRTVSYGHDIECAWLLREATEVLGDAALQAGTDPVVLQIAQASTEGLQADGSLICEYNPDTGKRDADRHWWPQAENLLGHFMVYRLTGRAEALQRVEASWRYIREQLVDRDGGEWFWSRRADGRANRDDDKAGFWKCPYHNGRMCIEFIERADGLLTQ